MTDSGGPPGGRGDREALAALGLSPRLFRRAALAHRLDAADRGGEPVRLVSWWLRWSDPLLLLLALAAAAGLALAAAALLSAEVAGRVP